MAQKTAKRVDQDRIAQAWPVNLTTTFRETITVATSADGASADNIEIAQLPVGVRLTDCVLATSATLGSGCTLKLQLANAADGSSPTDLTAATTAGGASVVKMLATLDPPVSTSTKYLVQATVGGANIAGTADVSVTLTYAVP